MEALRQEFSHAGGDSESVPADHAADGCQVQNEILEQNPGQLAVAVGLALRSFEDL